VARGVRIRADVDKSVFALFRGVAVLPLRGRQSVCVFRPILAAQDGNVERCPVNLREIDIVGAPITGRGIFKEKDCEETRLSL
jgi:hypothetical protein